MKQTAAILLLLLTTWPATADDKVVGLISRAAQPMLLDGKHDEWGDAFATPVHVGHPDYVNRGAVFSYLWDEQNLWIALRCLDRKPAHVGNDDQLWNGDAVEFYLDTRRGDQLGATAFGPGTLHMFWTPFMGGEVKPRLAVRALPALKDFRLKDAAVAAFKTDWGWTAEFKLPWAHFPGFTARAGEVIGLECELCSSDGGPRSDRTFVFASPAAVASPSAFGRVRLVEKLDPTELKACARVLLPLSLTQSANYAWLYGTACVSPTIAGAVARVEGKVLDAGGKTLKTSAGPLVVDGSTGFALWNGKWELFDLPAGTYSLELTARDRSGAAIVARTLKFLHGDPAPVRMGQFPSPMVEHARAHPRLKEVPRAGRREKLSVGTLFLPDRLPRRDPTPLFIHFHGVPWLVETAAATHGGTAAISVQLGSGSSVYGKAFGEPGALARLLREAEEKAGVRFEPVRLTAWSAGYGAVRAILRSAEDRGRVEGIVLLDGLHAGYVDGQPGPSESRLVEEDLAVFVEFAREAVAGRKRFLVTHSEVFPGTFASTTETADHLLKQLGLRRQAVLRWGPLQMQQLSDMSTGKFRVVGFAGNSAPDHVDHLHALPEFLRWLGELD